MRTRIAVLATLSIIFCATAAPQAKAPADPPLIDVPGYQKILEKYHGKPLLINF